MRFRGGALANHAAVADVGASVPSRTTTKSNVAGVGERGDCAGGTGGRGAG